MIGLYKGGTERQVVFQSSIKEIRCFTLLDFCSHQEISLEHLYTFTSLCRNRPVTCTWNLTRVLTGPQGSSDTQVLPKT